MVKDVYGIDYFHFDPYFLPLKKGGCEKIPLFTDRTEGCRKNCRAATFLGLMIRINELFFKTVYNPVVLINFFS